MADAGCGAVDPPACRPEDCPTSKRARSENPRSRCPAPLDKARQAGLAACRTSRTRSDWPAFKIRLPAAKTVRRRVWTMNDTSPPDHAGARQRTLGAAVAQLDLCQDGCCAGFRRFEWRHRHLVDADDAHDSSDRIGLPARGNAGGHRRPHHRRAGHHEAEMAEDALDLHQRHAIRAARSAREVGIDHAVFDEGGADHELFRRRYRHSPSPCSCHLLTAHMKAGRRPRLEKRLARRPN